MIERTRITYPKDVKFECVTTGFDFTIDDIETCNRCIEAVQCSLVPMPADKIKEQLQMLTALVVKPSGENADDMGFRIKMMANQLSQYPADIVLKAIESVAKESTFWPSFAEFWKHIGWRMHKRNRLLDSLTEKKLALIIQNQ